LKLTVPYYAKSFAVGAIIAVLCAVYLLVAPMGWWRLLVFLVWPSAILFASDLPLTKTFTVMLFVISACINGVIYLVVGIVLSPLLRGKSK
jgi:hypothetical protein